MSPASLHDQPRRSSAQINGLRPSPLKLNKDSHTIHKPSSSLAPPQRNSPVIIYTHSPKIIHTQARDFMALVQKLTGHSSDHPPPPPSPKQAKTMKPLPGGGGGVGSVSPVIKPSANPFLADIPLFTPNSTEHFFCSPRDMYRFSDTTTTTTTRNLSGNCNNPISPSVLEFLKGLPEY